MTDRELMQQALDSLEYVIQSVGGNAPESFDVWFQKTQVPAEALRARLAQPEPEPVAWWHDRGDFVDLNVSGHGTPLYFAPPQREWQGLTTQEIADETDIATSSNKDIFDLRKAFWCGARWAEAKLKEKNGF